MNVKYVFNGLRNVYNNSIIKMRYIMNNESSKQYLLWLVRCATEEEFYQEILAVIKRENSSGVINDFIEQIKLEIKEIDELIGLAKTIDEAVPLNKAKEDLLYKSKIISQALNEYELQINHEKKLEKFGCSGVLFAKNKYGNFMIDGDLKKLKSTVESQIYQDAIELIRKVSEDYDLFNKTLQKPLSGDSNLKGIYELKDFQLRLLYRYVGDFKVIIGIYLKKTDYDSKARQFMVNAKYQSQEFCDIIAKHQENIPNLIEESIKYFATLIAEERKI